MSSNGRHAEEKINGVFKLCVEGGVGYGCVPLVGSLLG